MYKFSIYACTFIHHLQNTWFTVMVPPSMLWLTKKLIYSKQSLAMDSRPWNSLISPMYHITWWDDLLMTSDPAVFYLWTRWSSKHLCDLIFLNAVVSAMTQGLSAINRFLSFFFWRFNIVKVEINVWTGLQCTFFKRIIVSNGKAYSKILCSAKPFRLRLYSNICKQ